MLHRRTVGLLILSLSAACADQSPTRPIVASESQRNSSAADAHATVVTQYESKDLAEYQQMWTNAYGPLELAAGGSLNVSSHGVNVSAVPFHVGADFSVFDHLKYIAVSNQAFSVSSNGSLTFSVEIEAATPGAVDGRVIHGCYGASFSWDGTSPCAHPWSAQTLEGQQAGVVLNMINFKTGQLFDWFVSSNQVFALIERLPTNVTGSPGVGVDKAYTQIIKTENVTPGRTHIVAITYTRDAGSARVEYFLDGRSFAKVSNIGIPLDVQGVPYTGIYPSYGPGSLVAADADSFVIGHGLFSLLDAFPFQHPDRPDLSVSVPMSERLFGQGAIGNFRHFRVTQTNH
jgi:hypothetical protein